MDKRYLSRVMLYLLLAVFGIALICEIAYQFYDSAYDGFEAINAVRTTHIQSVQTSGCFVRREEVLYSSADGCCRYFASDGEKVSVGQTVAKVYSSDSLASEKEKMDEISELEKQISKLERAQTLASGYTPMTVEQAIARLRSELTSTASDGDVKTLLKLREELTEMLAISGLVTGKTESYRTQIAALEEQRDELLRAMGNPIDTVFSTGSGYFYSEVDGYERFLDWNSDDLWDAENCLRLFDEMPDEDDSTKIPVGKLVRDYTWYLVCRVDANTAIGLSAGKTYTVCLDDQYKEVSLKLSYLSEDETSGDFAAVFSTDQMPTDMDYTRFQQVSIVLEKIDGYEIPSGAICMVGGVPGVYVLRGSVVQYREISSVYSGDGYIFSVENFDSDSEYIHLSYLDRIIVKGKDLYVGKIIS